MSEATDGPGQGDKSPLIRAKEVFLAVRGMPLPARDEELERLCAGDAALRKLVSELLAGEDSPLPFESLADDIVAAKEALSETARSGEESQLGTRIGRYRVLERIGEGGFGVVYLAEQEEPVRRRVALKVIKLGMDTRQVVARFEQERQALAVMDHPHIAKVHDGGATGSGRPFFVMEYCPGRSITEYCDNHRLSIGDRMRLFLQVCQAVQHAHQKGLIHRDIKPSNILVSEVDAKPMAKVIDFGIAKATQSRMTERTLFTEHGQLIGTPEYMSPEQAAGGVDIDTRTDIYSLGVLLYELLTGSTPFDSRSLRSAAYEEVRRIIREVEPPRPSTRLSQSSDTIAGVAAARRAEPRRLNSLIRGELDWVVMKALDKARDRRYSSAAEFAGDIERYLRDEPVEARPATAAYRWRKFVRRNKVAVGAGAAIGIILIAGIAATSIMYAKAERARIGESQQRLRAESKSATTQAINEFLTQDMLAAPNPWDGGGRKTTVAEVLDKAAAKASKRFAGKPEIEASIRETLGESYRSLGLFREAEPQYERVLELRGAATGDEEAGLADAFRMKAANLQALARYKEAEPICRDALDRHKRLFGPDSRQVAESLECMADIQNGLSQYVEAQKSLREALRIREKLAPDAADDIALARLTNTLSNALLLNGTYDEAEKIKNKALEMFKAASGERSAYYAQVLNDLGALYFLTEQYDRSERCYVECLPVMLEILGAEHATTLLTRRSYANTLSYLGKDREAEPMLKEIIAASERILGPMHADTLGAINCLATMYLRASKHADAEPLYCSMLDRATKSLGETHAETLKYATNLAWCESYLNKPEDAERYFRMATDGFLATLGQKHPDTIASQDGYAQFLGSQKRWKEAADEDKLVLEARAAAGRPEGMDTARILSRMGNNLMRAGDFAAARAPLTRSLELCLKNFPEADWRTGTAKGRLGECLSNLGMKEEAEELVLAGVKSMRADPKTPPDSLKAGLERVAAHYERNGDEARAADVRKQMSPTGTPGK